MAWHVLPTNDIEEHEESTTCKCEPRVVHENGEMIIVHNSFDGREGVEIANEILTPKS
jgi:hypothetical protein